MKNIIALIISAITAAYTVWYMHFEKPWTNDGALSTIGLEHKALFTVWGILTFVTISALLITGYKSIDKIKIALPLLCVSGLGMALTLIFKFKYGTNPDYYLHCAGSLVFSAVTGAAVFILFILKKNYVFAGITAIIMIADLICLIIFKETGLIEALPLFAGYILLNTDNIRSERLETSRKVKRT